MKCFDCAVARLSSNKMQNWISGNVYGFTGFIHAPSFVIQSRLHRLQETFRLIAHHES